MKTVVAAIALAALAFPVVSIADCGAEHAAMMSASVKPAATALPEAKVPAADKSIASNVVKQPVAKAKAVASEQKVATNTAPK